MINYSEKNISDEDLEVWAQYASLGSIGVAFFSKGFDKPNSTLLEFFLKCGSTADSFIILTPENTFSEEEMKILSLIPYVHFVYSKGDGLDFIEKMGCNHFFKFKNQELSEPLQKIISNLENCQTHEF